jgi:hypothetical protein
MPKKLFIDSPYGKVCVSYQAVAGGRSAAILAHGFNSNKDTKVNKVLVDRLSEKGISTIALDLYGHGESAGSIETLTLRKAVSGFLAAYDFATAEGFEKIGISGSSFSGGVSLLAASERVFSAVALRCPLINYRELWEVRLGPDGIRKWRASGFAQPFAYADGHKLGYAAYEDVCSIDMRQTFGRINAPVLAIHGTADAQVSPKNSEEVAHSVAGEKRLVLIEGADHVFTNPSHFERMVSEVCDWFAGKLALGR